MSSKKTEVIDINVDELALSLVGWQVEDAQARLVTESHDRSDHEQHIAFSGTFRFLPEDWTDRFYDTYASRVSLTLNRHDRPAPSGNYQSIVRESIKKANKGLIRVAEQSDKWTCRAPLAPTDIDLRLTAYDLEHCENGRICLPSASTTRLDIIVVDETSVEAPHPKVTAAHAYVSKNDYSTTLTVHAEGTFEFGSAEDLVKTYVEQQELEKYGRAVMDFAPFNVVAPEITFEILDDTGFLLGDRTCMLFGHIPVDEQGNVPRRQPRWVGRAVININDLPGDPHRVVVRVSDGER